MNKIEELQQRRVEDWVNGFFADVMGKDNTPFRDWKYKTAVSVIPPIESFEDMVCQFYDGEHWQNGEGWSGAWPHDQNNESCRVAIKQIKRHFVCTNLIKEIVERHTAGVVGRSVEWSVVSKSGDGESAEAEALKKEATAVLTTWARRHKLDTFMQDAVRAVLLRCNVPIRLFVPEIEAGEDLAATALRIYPQLLEKTTAVVHTDKRTLRDVGVYRYALDESDVLDYKNQQQYELNNVIIPIARFGHTMWDTPVWNESNMRMYPPPQELLPDEPVGEIIERDGAADDKDSAVEMSYLLRNGQTALRIVHNKEGLIFSPDLDLDGLLTYHDFCRGEFVSKCIVDNQKAYNHASTAANSNLATAGFTTRMLLNAQPPGQKVKNADGSETFVPAPFVLNPGSINAVAGHVITDVDANGKAVTKLSTPQYVQENPADANIFEKLAKHYRKNVYRESMQLHVEQNGVGSGNAGFRSRQQSAADFEASLGLTAKSVSDLVEWMLTAVLHFAAHLSGNPKKFYSLQVVAVPVLDLGVIGVEEKESALKAWQAGLLSRESAVIRWGIDNVGAELERIAKEKDEEVIEPASETPPPLEDKSNLVPEDDGIDDV